MTCQLYDVPSFGSFNSIICQLWNARGKIKWYSAWEWKGGRGGSITHCYSLERNNNKANQLSNMTYDI